MEENKTAETIRKPALLFKKRLLAELKKNKKRLLFSCVETLSPTVASRKHTNQQQAAHYVRMYRFCVIPGIQIAYVRILFVSRGA